MITGKLRIKRIKRSDLLLYFGTVVFVAKTVFSVSKIIPYNNFTDILLSIIGSVVLIISILLQNYQIKTLLLYAAFIGLTLYNSWVTGNNVLVITVISCLAVRNSNLTNYIKMIFRIESILLIIHSVIAIVGSTFGVFNIVQDIGGVMRYDFGMKHPNSFAALAFNLLIMFIWLKWDRIKIRHIIAMAICAGIVFVFCKTRTNFMTMLIVIGLLFIRKFNHRLDRTIEKLAFIIVPLFSVFMGFAIIFYTTGNSVIVLLNKILNARISLGAYALAHYRFTLFGQNMEALYTGTIWDSVWMLNAFTFDCIYTYMLINQGIIWLVLLTILFVRLAKRKNVRDNVAIISWALYGLTEVQGLNCFSCMPILLLTKLFRKEQKQYG